MSDIKIVIGADVGQATAGLSKLNTSLVSFKNTSGQATQAMVNLGRVVQDAPYGFIGIANNLNPLIESFQRLKAESGSTGGALKALGSSLMGAGGLGIAVSVVTSALSFYALNAQKANNETEKTAKAVEITKDTYQKFREEVEKTTASVATEASKISILFGALGDANIKLNDRRSIISQLNELSPKYLGNLDAEKSSYEDISKAISGYVDDLGKSAFIKSFLPQFEEIFKKLVKAQVDLRELDLAQKGIFGLSEADYAKERERLTTQIRLFKQDIVSAKKFLTREAGGENSLYEILFGKKPKDDKPVKVPVKIEPYIDPRKYPNSLRNLFKDIEDKDFKLKINVNAQPEIKIDPAGINKASILLADQLAKAFTEITNNTLNDAISSLADGIGKALGGNGKFKNIFSGLYSVLGAGLKELGKYLVKTYALIKAIEEIKFKNAAVGIAVGVALQILGATIQSRVQSQNAFATGVRNFGGGIATVGERGPETIFLPRGSSVQPNNEMLAYGGGEITVHVVGSISGEHIVLSGDRARAKMGRNN